MLSNFLKHTKKAQKRALRYLTSKVAVIIYIGLGAVLLINALS